MGAQVLLAHFEHFLSLWAQALLHGALSTRWKSVARRCRAFSYVLNPYEL